MSSDAFQCLYLTEPSEIWNLLLPVFAVHSYAPHPASYLHMGFLNQPSLGKGLTRQKGRPSPGAPLAPCVCPFSALFVPQPFMMCEAGLCMADECMWPVADLAGLRRKGAKQVSATQAKLDAAKKRRAELEQDCG